MTLPFLASASWPLVAAALVSVAVAFGGVAFSVSFVSVVSSALFLLLAEVPLRGVAPILWLVSGIASSASRLLFVSAGDASLPFVFEREASVVVVVVPGGEILFATVRSGEGVFAVAMRVLVLVLVLVLMVGGEFCVPVAVGFDLVPRPPSSFFRKRKYWLSSSSCSESEDGKSNRTWFDSESEADESSSSVPTAGVLFLLFLFFLEAEALDDTPANVLVTNSSGLNFTMVQLLLCSDDAFELSRIGLMLASTRTFRVERRPCFDGEGCIV